MNNTKLLYRSTSIFTVKVLALMIPLVLGLNLYFQTYSSKAFNTFIENKELMANFESVWIFHKMYPHELIFYIITICIPAIYYGFIRGVRFYEDKVIINRGLPFFNMEIPFEDIGKFEIIHPKFFLSITRKDTEDEILFTVNNVDRVLALLDQHNIKGQLGKGLRKDGGTHKKLILFFLIVGSLMAFVQYFGVIRFIFQ